jgi:2-amino-4-hydroxy-6-hydroxymethyldihydropteridine diphosphokinase
MYMPRLCASVSEAAFIGLGSNLAGPQRQLSIAVLGLARLGQVVGRSSLYQSRPLGDPPGQPDYLNAVVALLPSCTEPEQLLAGLLELEREQGRVRLAVGRRRPEPVEGAEPGERWAARSIDLDLLSWGSRVVVSETLILPHPRLLERTFVLAPLCELYPAWRHPVSGVSACEALAGLAEQGWVKTGLPWLT